MSVTDTVATDRSSAPAYDTVRGEYNKLNLSAIYFLLNKLVAATIATLPAVARATTASRIKTTNTTIAQIGTSIVPLVSLTGTDNLFDLTPDAANVLAAGSCRRYQLCWDGTSATTVVSVRASNDTVIASYANAAAALAACRWPSLPPNGTVIIGILSIQNTTNPFIPGTTLLSAAGVTDTYRDGFDAACGMSSQVTV
jgi:hypothetical protein